MKQIGKNWTEAVQDMVALKSLDFTGIMKGD
jgi:hypothetical protein